jgi:hypothetical protein
MKYLSFSSSAARAQSLFQTREGLKADHRKSEDTGKRCFSTTNGLNVNPFFRSATGLMQQNERVMEETGGIIKRCGWSLFEWWPNRLLWQTVGATNDGRHKSGK